MDGRISRCNNAYAFVQLEAARSKRLIMNRNKAKGKQIYIK